MGGGVEAAMAASVVASGAVAAFQVEATVGADTVGEDSVVRAATRGNGPAPRR